MQWRSFLTDWYKVVYAKTETELEQQWTSFKQVYNGPFTDSTAYIQEQWLNWGTKQTFLFCYTSKFFHANQISTSRGEGAHSLLKNELKSSVGDLLHVVHTFENIIKAQQHDIKLAKENDQNRVPITLRKSIFSLVTKKISSYCLFEVQKMIEKYLLIGLGKLPISPVCTGSTHVYMGIPCIHTLSSLLARSEPLQITHFHPHWLISNEAQDIEIDPRLLVLPPQVSVRGRPPGALNNPPISSQASATVRSIQREPLAFEYTIAEDTQALQPIIRAMQAQDPTLTTRRAQNTAPTTRRARNTASITTWEAPAIVSGVPTDMQSVIRF